MIDAMIDDVRWDAVRARRADPSFIFAVRTTRVACRAGCPSPTPQRRNVTFFDDLAAAREAGFRPCKRCAPDDVDATAHVRRAIERACAVLDANDAPSLDRLASDAGFSRFHFQRAFRTVTGVTPGAYRRTARARRFKQTLATESSVTRATYDAGFGSPSRALASAPLGMTPSTFRRGAPGERIAYAVAPCSLGRVLVAATERGICAIALGDDDDATIASLRRDFPLAAIVADAEALGARLSRVIALVEGRPYDAHLALDVRGTAFQCQVWDALRAIPTGEHRTYADVAREVGRPSGARAVAAACAANPVAVAIPCHRVVGGDGGDRGYRWGLGRKRALFDRERACGANESDA